MLYVLGLRQTKDLWNVNEFFEKAGRKSVTCIVRFQEGKRWKIVCILCTCSKKIYITSLSMVVWLFNKKLASFVRTTPQVYILVTEYEISYS
jgi:hypothetical protein